MKNPAKYFPADPGDPWHPELKGDMPTAITSINDVRYDRYSKLKVVSIYKMGDIYHCETDCGQYLWFEAHAGSLVMCLAEVSHKLGENSEPVSNYTGKTPTLKQIIEHMKWKIDDENIWDG